MGYLSILVGFFLVLFLICKKWPAIIVGIIATAAVIVMNWLNFGQTFTDVYFTGFATMVKSLFPPIFAGNLVAQIYNRTGAVRSISDTMSNALFKEGRSKTRTYVSCILAIVIPTGLLAYCGMNGLVTLIAFYPIALGLMERAGIPKRYVMGLLSFGVYAFALTGPGTAQLVNVLSMQVVGEGPAAGLVGGLVGVVVEIVFGTFVLTLMIKKDVAKGLKFAYGPNDIRVADDKQLPNFLISLIPLLSVVIFFNVVKLDIFSSCLARGSFPLFCSASICRKRTAASSRNCSTCVRFRHQRIWPLRHGRFPVRLCQRCADPAGIPGDSQLHLQSEYGSVPRADPFDQYRGRTDRLILLGYPHRYADGDAALHRRRHVVGIRSATGRVCSLYSGHAAAQLRHHH